MKKILNLLLCLLLAHQANAERKEYPIDIRKRIVIPISEHGINRIALDRDRISRIIGNDAEYILDSDLSRGQVFITSKLVSGDNFFITLVSEKGVIQDIKFKVEELREPVSVVLKTHTPITKSTASTIKKDYSKIKEEAVGAIRDILTGNIKSFTTRVTYNANRRPNKKLKPLIRPLSLFLEKVVKVTELRRGSLKILYVEWSEAPKLKYEILTRYFPKLVAATNKGNSLIIVERII